MSSKAIESLQKQNNSIYASLIAKNIQFERVELLEGTSEDEILRLLNEENTNLKALAKASKPAQQPIPKEEKKKVENPPANIKKEDKKENKDDDGNEEEENYEEPVKKFTTIINMEDMKRAFFNGEYEGFENQLKSNPLKIFKVGYKYNSDKDGVPEFSAKNLLKGFVRSFNDHKKYFMICFRCWKHQSKQEYKYDSLWIVNTNDNIQDIIGSVWDDFEFVELNRDPISNIDEFIGLIKKTFDSNSQTDEPQKIDGEYVLIDESYVH